MKNQSSTINKNHVSKTNLFLFFWDGLLGALLFHLKVLADQLLRHLHLQKLPLLLTQLCFHVLKAKDPEDTNEYRYLNIFYLKVLSQHCQNIEIIVL